MTMIRTCALIAAMARLRDVSRNTCHKDRLLILPLSDRGHPPLFVIALIPFWLLNVALLPAAFTALRVGYKQHEERKTDPSVKSFI